MKLSSIVLSLVPTVLGEVISPAEPSSDCHADNCYRAVAGDDVRFDVKSRREDCSLFMVAATASLSASLSEAAPTTLPVYASLCYSVAAYSSACSCWGITADKFTADAVPTAVAPATATAVLSSLSSAATSSLPASNSTSPTATLPSTRSSVLSSSSLSSTRSSVPPSSSLSTVKSSTTSIRSTTPSLSSTQSTTRSSSSTSTSTTPTTIFSSTRSSTSTSPIPTSTTSTNSTSGNCVGQKCGTYRAWPCSGPLGDCLCGLDPDGRSFCFEDNVCSVETDCSRNVDCPSRQRCVVGSCCMVGKCVVERKDGVCGNVNSARAIFRPRGMGEGEREGKRCGEGSNSGGC